MAIKASNQISIVDVTDAYSVILTSEAFTSIGNTSGAASGPICETQAVAYCGTTQCSSVSVTDSAVKFYNSSGTEVTTNKPTVTVTGSGTSTVNIKFTLTAALTAALEARIPVVVDGITVNKKFSMSVAKTGQPGTSVTVSSTEYAYQLSTSGTTIPTGTWETTPQAPTTTQYAWTRTTTTFSDGSTAVTYTVGGKVGQQGQQGQQGNPGVSPTVTNTKTQYQKSTSGTTVPTGTWSDTALAPDTSNYVWTKTTITYSDGATAVTYAVAGKQGSAGTSAVTVIIKSSAGTVFKNNTGTTDLIAQVFQGVTEKTVNETTGVVASSLGTIKWYKGLPTDTQPSGFPKAAGKITVSASDVASVQAYTCQLEG